MSSALGEFLRHRRGRVRPTDVGLPAGPGRRRTSGLRREELAALAGVSVDYYTRLEQGRDTNPGDAVLDALATALRLDDDERAHLHGLVRRPRTAPAPDRARPGLRSLLAAVRPLPGYVLDAVSNVLALNPEGAWLLPGLDEAPPERQNLVRYVFTHPAARQVFAAWEGMARDCVAHLRTVPDDAPGRRELVDGLRAADADFAALWADYEVRVKSGAPRPFRHPRVGRLTLTSEVLNAVDGQRLVVFRAEPGTPDHDALRLLAPAYARGTAP
ncbi:helix-turn-helix transcriptional regulator [Saccharothrix syringae]|uniref:XRE family transcriptional regulator n=1 Tax=Saccharothrix syringae TaxID=103733 RepID=A0A5Q0GXA9_SACSY|nr:helix-turn-helix transcriptional regulator [Saccharothrix syringae]QFZ18174.1 XRE family transcriptional regulator [Saccharothrix syringae]